MKYKPLKYNRVLVGSDTYNDIFRMLYGPYKKSWFVKGQVDNRDKTIAKRLGLNITVVQWATIHMSNQKAKDVAEANKVVVKTEKL